MVTNSRRLSDKQCEKCYKNALDDTRVLPCQNDERDPEQDLPPYKTDMCFYHEHPNEEDRDACRRRREALKPAV